MNVVPMRERQINVRLSEEEGEWLDTVTEHYGINVANLFRMMLKKELRVVEQEKASAKLALAYAQNPEAAYAKGGGPLVLAEPKKKRTKR